MDIFSEYRLLLFKLSLFALNKKKGSNRSRTRIIQLKKLIKHERIKLLRTMKTLYIYSHLSAFHKAGLIDFEKVMQLLTRKYLAKE